MSTELSDHKNEMARTAALAFAHALASLYRAQLAERLIGAYLIGCRECGCVEAVLCDERNIYIAVTVAKPAMSEAPDEIRAYQPFAELRPI